MRRHDLRNVTSSAERPGDDQSRDELWRTAQRDLGYRRFFDVNSLIGLRTELEEVFQGTHHLVLDWIRRGVIDGLRIDHPDGLRDPEQYLARLRQAAPDGWLVVEKILERDERLRESWPVDGTTGYEYLNRVGRLFVDPDGEQPLTELYERFTGEPTDVGEIIRQSKLLVLREILGSDLGRLTAILVDICEHGYLDARLTEGVMTESEVEDWTSAILQKE